MRPLGPDTITLVIPAQTVNTRDNSTYLDYDNPTLVVVPDCNIQPFRIAEKLQEELTIERDFSRSTWRVWAPSTPEVMAVKPHDRVLFDGVEYEVFGLVGSWRRFSGTNHHTQFVMERRVG